MTRSELLNISDAADVITYGSIAMFIYHYSPYLPCPINILPMDSYYVACNTAYKKIRAAKLGKTANDVNIKQLLLYCGFTVGRSTLLLHPDFGSYFLIQAIRCDFQLPVLTLKTKAPECGECTLCKNACPGSAIGTTPMDFKRINCLRDMMDRPLTEQNTALLGLELLGCEVCRKVCPRNSSVTPEPMPAELLRSLELSRILEFSPDTRASLSGYIGGNMARPAILLPQAMAAAVRRRRYDLIDQITALTHHPSARVSSSARICASMLMAK